MLNEIEFHHVRTAIILLLNLLELQNNKYDIEKIPRQDILFGYFYVQKEKTMITENIELKSNLL